MHAGCPMREKRTSSVLHQSNGAFPNPTKPQPRHMPVQTYRYNLLFPAVETGKHTCTVGQTVQLFLNRSGSAAGKVSDSSNGNTACSTPQARVPTGCIPNNHTTPIHPPSHDACLPQQSQPFDDTVQAVLVKLRIQPTRKLHTAQSRR